MARRNDHTREELMEMAISAGQKIISEDGFDQFSARKVAKEIGYTVGTIYNIFDSHNDLILHINSATLDDMYAFITHKMNKKHSGNNAIKNLFSYYIMFAQENYNRWSALFEFNIPQGDSLPDWQTNKSKYRDEHFVLRVSIHDHFHKGDCPEKPHRIVF